MVHQIAPDLIGTVGNAILGAFLGGIQQQAGRFDSVGGDNHNLARGCTRAAICTPKVDRSNLAIRRQIKSRSSGLIINDGSCRLGLFHMHGCVVIRLNRTDRNAGRAAAAFRTAA